MQAEICYNRLAMTKYITSAPGIIGGKPAIAGTAFRFPGLFICSVRSIP
jgi:hypothetical protein